MSTEILPKHRTFRDVFEGREGLEKFKMDYSLGRTNFGRVLFKNIHFGSQLIEFCDFDGSCFQKCSTVGTIFQRCSFKDSQHLKGVYTEGECRHCNFMRMKAEYCNFNGRKFLVCDFATAEITRCRSEETTYTDCKFWADTLIIHSYLICPQYINCKFSGSRFEDCYAPRMRLVGTTMFNMTFHFCDLTGMWLEASEEAEEKRPSLIQQSQFTECNLTGLNKEGGEISGAEFDKCHGIKKT